MSVHLCRDFLTVTTASSPATSMYLLAAFMQHVLSFDQFAQVNFDLTSSQLVTSQGSLPSSFASINLGSGSEYSVHVPASVHVVNAADVGRILALRSSVNPTYNSGLFRINSINVLSNSFSIDYRTSEFPPAESGSLPWRVYENEVLVPAWKTGSNGYAGGVYQSKGIASASRVMLSAPKGWQLRLCLESPADVSGTIPAGFSIAPGMGHLPTADFDDVGGNLHGGMWFNTTSSAYLGSVVGLTPNSSATLGQWRMTMLGDDVNGTCLAFCRNVSFVSGGTGWAAFGLPEDEALPLSPNMIDRVFVVGNGNKLPNLTWQTGFFDDGIPQGLAWSRFGFPMPCVMSSYAQVANVDPHERNFAWASSSSFAPGQTELVDVEIIAGTMANWRNATGSVLVPFAPRRVGRFPMARQGRGNYPQWATTPNKQWLHTQDGVFVPWSGPFLSGSLTGSAVILTATGSFQGATDSSMTDGVWMLDASPPMQDPFAPVPPSPDGTDASRYIKTYSRFRQVPDIIQVFKDGSNPSRP